MQLTQRGDRPGGFDLTTDEAAELHVSLKVIGQGCKQHLTGYLRSGAASELPQPAFAFDPSVRKLGNSCALAIYLLGMTVLIRSSNLLMGNWCSETVSLRPVCFSFLC